MYLLGRDYLIFYNTIEMLATIIEFTIGILFIGSIMGKSINVCNEIFLSLFLSGLVVLINQYKLFTIYTTIIGILGIALCSKLTYKIRYLDAIFLSIMYLVLIHIIDFLSISICGIILNNYHFGYDVITIYSIERLYHIIVTKIILISVYILMVKRYLNKTHTLIKKLWGTLFISILIVYKIGRQTLLGINMNLLLIWILIFTIIIISSYSLYQYVIYSKQKEKLNFITKKNQMILNKNKDLIDNYNSIEEYYHDLKNHNIVIEGYFNNKIYSVAEEYYNGLNMNISKNKQYNNWTGNDILNYFIEYKKKFAENKSIKFIISSDIVKLNIAEQDIISLFGNAIDNAIEACENIDKDEKWIKIVIKKSNEIIFIKISNSYNTKPIKIHEKYITNKKYGKHHGLGIQKMKNIVNNYEGLFVTEVSNNIFTIIISFFD